MSKSKLQRSQKVGANRCSFHLCGAGMDFTNCAGIAGKLRSFVTAQFFAVHFRWCSFPAVPIQTGPKPNTFLIVTRGPKCCKYMSRAMR